ncbi:MAG: thioesterase family protein [Ardenticatenaceae bacterium]|nr:thioesterase family protein [Ardenticatenaceae bacterium]
MTTIENLNPLPALYRVTITDEHLDVMGHMNIRWYMAFFDDGDWQLFADVGADFAYFEREQAGQFALQHFIRYLAEVRVGETVVIKGRMIGRSDNGKRVHYLLFMVNESTNTLAATMECLASHADLTIRRTAPYPPPILAKLDALIAAHNQLAWDVPLSGVMNV